jgi:hypothetical protein
MYFDSDIMVAKPLAPFWESVSKVWKQGEVADNENGSGDQFDDDFSLRRNKVVEKKQPVSLGLFQDCGSYTAGFSKDCDTWNTGIISMRRGASDQCLNAWCSTLQDIGGSDQAALDTVIASGSQCQNIQALDRQHVRMMKDVFVLWGMIGTRTFNHFTGIFRPQKLSTIHRRFYARMLGKDLSRL